LKFISKLIILVIVFVVAYLGTVFTYEYYNTPKHKYSKEDVKKIYDKLLAQTGQTQDGAVLVLEENPTINAYTDGTKVVIYRGMLDYVQNDDELALVLAHEIAHDMLKHVAYPEFSVDQLTTSVAEANADKMGALYMLKAGYSVCNGRELWHRFEKTEGNYQGFDHPTYGYRYNELNVGCY